MQTRLRLYLSNNGALLAAFFTPLMLNLSKKNNRNKTVYKGACLYSIEVYKIKYPQTFAHFADEASNFFFQPSSQP